MNGLIYYHSFPTNIRIKYHSFLTVIRIKYYLKNYENILNNIKMDTKLLIILMLVMILVLISVTYTKSHQHVDNSCEGKWLGGVIVLLKESNDSNTFNICYHNKDSHITLPCRARFIDKHTIKLFFVNNTHFPYIADNCVSMVYDKLNDVLVYRGKNLKDSIFDESKFKYEPDEVFVVIGRNNIQVIHNWNGIKTNCLRVNGHLLKNISDFHEDGYLSYLDVRHDRPSGGILDEHKYVVDCNTNLMDKFVYLSQMDKSLLYDATIYTSQCQGPWLGGSVNIKQLSDNSYEFCNLSGDGCAYARVENNRFILNPTNDLYKEEREDNKLCNSLYYCKDNDVFVWYGDPCLKNYSDLDNKINSDIYMVIGRKQLIFYIGNVDAVESAKPQLELLPYIYDPKKILVRPYM